MSPERRERRSNEQYPIQLGIPFKPYERMRSLYWPKNGEDPLKVPERYEHILALRKQVSLYGMDGAIDVVSENPREWSRAIASMAEGIGVEQPMGLAYFHMIIGPEQDDIEFSEVPFILRFTFLAKTPAQYAKLLNSYADVELGKEKYLAAWNVHRPSIDERMKKLESGEQAMVVEKNLFNLKKYEKAEEEGMIMTDEEPTKRRRLTYVWLPVPDDLSQYRAIRITFNQFDDDGDNQEDSIDPSPNQRELVLTERQLISTR